MISSVFVDRPRLAIVIAIIMTLAGALSTAAHPRRAIPGHRAAAGSGHHPLPGRLGVGRRSPPSPSRSRRRSTAPTA